MSDVIERKRGWLAVHKATRKMDIDGFAGLKSDGDERGELVEGWEWLPVEVVAYDASPPPRPASEVVETEEELERDLDVLTVFNSPMSERRAAAHRMADTIRVLRGWPQRKEGVKP